MYCSFQFTPKIIQIAFACNDPLFRLSLLIFNDIGPKLFTITADVVIMDVTAHHATSIPATFRDRELFQVS